MRHSALLACVSIMALAMAAPPVWAQAPDPQAETWVAKPAFELAALDKVTARVSALTGRVGQTLSFGTLTIAVRGCIARGPDQPSNEAAFLDITDRRDATLAFHGWMLKSNPGLSMLEHPIYDIRVAGCRG